MTLPSGGGKAPATSAGFVVVADPWLAVGFTVVVARVVVSVVGASGFTCVVVVVVGVPITSFLRTMVPEESVSAQEEKRWQDEPATPFGR